MVDLPSSPLGDIDAEFEKLGLETGGMTFALTGTTIREKLLQNLANDICRQQLGLAFELHVTAAHQFGIPYADLLALLRFTAPYAGYPAADALGRISEIAASIGMDTTPQPVAPAQPAGEKSGPPEESTKPDQPIASADPWMAEFLQSRISRASSEQRLSPRERAFVALTTAVSQGTLNETFDAHVRHALQAGANPNQIRDAVRFCAEMGVAKAADALRALDTILTDFQ